MQNLDENIDLDALFDMLNIVDSESAPAAPGKDKPATALQQPSDHILQNTPSLEDEFFIFDQPTDQS